MAQVMYFQRDKSVTETQADIPAYTSNGDYKVKVDGIPAGSTIDWDNMLDTYGSANAKQKKAVADLMHYCGVSVQMMYNIGANGGSAAFSYNVATALVNYFGYGSSVKYVYQPNFTDDAWD